jgi:hypothetical protein
VRAAAQAVRHARVRRGPDLIRSSTRAQSGQLGVELAAAVQDDRAGEAAEEVADVVELLHRMARRLVCVEVLTGSILGGVGLVAAGVLATLLKIYLG